MTTQLTGNETLVVATPTVPFIPQTPPLRGITVTTGDIAALSSPSLPGQAIAAAGTSQGTAAALIVGRNYVESGSGGVLLPHASTFNGAEVPVFNRSGAAIAVYPFPNDQIESGAVNVPVTLSNNSVGRFSVDPAGIVRMA
jgi:hypothetical protein